MNAARTRPKRRANSTTYFHSEFGLFGSTGGHSYQYGHYICDYYLKSLGLPEIGGKGLYAAQEKPDLKK